ncbi:unnamed protein product [Calypogeia fissa]
MAAMMGLSLQQSSSCCLTSNIIAPCVDFTAPRTSSSLVVHSTCGGSGLESSFAGSVQSLRVQHCGGGVVLKNVGQHQQVSRFGSPPRAMAEETTAAPTSPEVFEVELEKPFGLRFYKGADGGTYIDVIQPGSNADRTGLFTVGDKVLATSAVFGTEIWPAAEYGRTMYTIRQRIGTLLMRMEKRYGKREDQANAEQIAKERNAGQIGDAVREIQIKNYLRKQELKEQREEELTEGVKLYKAGKYQDALGRFETVLGLKPEFRETAVASYNVACCYSRLEQMEAGISALEEAMEAGFDDYKGIREDPDLAHLRTSPKFKEVLDKYDEPFLNENAFKAIKSVFGIFGGKK